MQHGCEHWGAKGVRLSVFVGCVALVFCVGDRGHAMNMVLCWVVQGGVFGVRCSTDMAQWLGSAVLAMTFCCFCDSAVDIVRHTLMMKTSEPVMQNISIPLRVHHIVAAT
jgi:hypothetical protein